MVDPSTHKKETDTMRRFMRLLGKNRWAFSVKA
jgi:hypothetical protein